jgi:hypothetical protein
VFTVEQLHQCLSALALKQGPSLKSKGIAKGGLFGVAFYCTVEESRSLHFLYLVDEVEKGGLLMVSLKWMMHIVDGMCYWWRMYSNFEKKIFK